MYIINIRGGVEDTRLKAKDTKKIRGQGQPSRGQTLLRPRTGMLEAKAKDQGHKAQVLSKKKKKKEKVFKNFFSENNGLPKKCFTRFRESREQKLLRKFSANCSVLQPNFKHSKNSAVLEPRTGQFSRT